MHWSSPRFLVGLVAATLLVPSGALAQQNPVALQDLVVTGTRSPHALADVPVETLVITREEIERAPVQNLPQLLRTLPGVSATNLDDTLASDNLRLTVRGLQLNEGYGLILVDGRRVHGGLGAHGDYGISLNQIPLSMIERIEVVKGASSALYGADAMAGVINIITRRVPQEASASAGVSYGLYSVLPRAGVKAQDPIRRTAQVHANLGTPVGDASGLLLHFAHQSDEGSDRLAQTTLRDSVLAKWHTALTDTWSVDLAGDLAWSRRDTVPGQDARYDRKLDDYRAAAALNYKDDRHAWTLSGYRFNQDFEQGFEGFQHGFRFGDVGYYQAESVYTYFGERQWLTVGAEAQRQSLDYVFNNYRGGELEAQVPVKENIDIYSLFVQDEIWLLDERLILVPGVRFEDHSRFGSEINPKFSASLRTGAATTWRASVGRAFKSPTIRQLYYEGLYRHGDNYVESNPNLDPETAINANLSVEQLWWDGNLWGSLGVFRTDVKNMVVRTDTGREFNDLPIESFENVQKARIQGAELAFRAGGPRGFTLRGSAAWTAAENRDTDLDLPYVPDYTAALIPGYVTASGQTGVEATLLAVGRQYRNVANTQRVESHQIVDVRLWRELGPQVSASLDFGNIFESNKGDKEFAWRQGRSVVAGLNARF
ncbi:TonB-dependent receptor plug domain-containing protein [Geoalkalibacter halelectricus]|uniref:TonB-dependent receptor n=1 Tax=Geoalkalibacter halelectricus TaxID=2847045 RepID=A0ABY5ZIC6_9BACT|nr:TonB-dependent receptor [Geoalkalibacter halelectricus]MDO3377232.1 TonB-dependent receptor [Geoalkalibacter halelectricus]UWZ78871.1 TonB-dependent receptor [Geoalkalibacter halelectricus]